MKENVNFFIFFCCVKSKSDIRIRLKASFRVWNPRFSSGYSVFGKIKISHLAVITVFGLLPVFRALPVTGQVSHYPQCTHQKFSYHVQKTVWLFLRSVARKVVLRFWHSKKSTLVIVRNIKKCVQTVLVARIFFSKGQNSLKKYSDANYSNIFTHFLFLLSFVKVMSYFCLLTFKAKNLPLEDVIYIRKDFQIDFSRGIKLTWFLFLNKSMWVYLCFYFK